jgi:Flp pilus assembly pilin Flp
MRDDAIDSALAKDEPRAPRGSKWMGASRSPVARDRTSVEHRGAGVNGSRLRPWSRLRSAIAGLRYGEQGLTTLEYALLMAVAAVLLIVAVGFLGSKIDDRVGKSGSAPGMSTVKPPTVQCDSNYSGACVPPAPPDLDCTDLRALGLHLPVGVVGGDPHGLDPDGDGLGC